MEVLSAAAFVCVLVGVITGVITWALTRPPREEEAKRAGAAAKYDEAIRRTSELRTLRELEAARADQRSADEREALIVRRWLRNAMEDPNTAPHKAVGTGAAIALALCGGAEFAKFLAAMKTEHALLSEGLAPTDPEVQAAKHWDNIRAEYFGLSSSELELATARENLFGEREGGYWNAHLLTRAAQDVLAKSHAGAVEIARQRLSGAPASADLATKH